VTLARLVRVATIFAEHKIPSPGIITLNEFGLELAGTSNSNTLVVPLFIISLPLTLALAHITALLTLARPSKTTPEVFKCVDLTSVCMVIMTPY